MLFYLTSNPMLPPPGIPGSHGHHNPGQVRHPCYSFPHFSKKTYVVGIHWKHLIEMLPMSPTAYVLVQKWSKYRYFCVGKIFSSRVSLDYWTSCWKSHQMLDQSEAELIKVRLNCPDMIANQLSCTVNH